MLQLGRRGKGEQDAECHYGRESPLLGCYDGVTGTGTTPAAFYLGLCRLRGILSPPASATVILQEAVLTCGNDGLQRFSSLGLKSRITARWRAFSGKSMQ